MKKVLIQGELLSVNIRYLPAKSTPEMVSKLLSRLDIHVPANSIRTAPDDVSRHTTDEKFSRAVVTTENLKLHEIIFGKTQASDRPDPKDVDLSKLTVFGWHTRGPHRLGSFPHHISSRTVVLNWRRPMKNVQLNFKAREAAVDCRGRFIKGNYKVLGEQVSMALPHFGRPLAPTTRLHLRPEVYPVRLSVPMDASVQDVLNSMPYHKLPDDVEFEGTELDLTDDPCASQWLESTLNRFGALETELKFKFLEQTQNFEGAVRFKNEADAREATMHLNRVTLPYPESGKYRVSEEKLSATNLHTATYQLSERVLGAVWDDVKLMQLPFESEEKGVQFAVYFSGSQQMEEERLLTLHLSSKNLELITYTKKKVDAMLEGHTLGAGDDDLTLQERVLALQCQDIKNLERRFGVAIYRLPTLKEVRLYGTKSKIDQCGSALRDLADCRQSQRRTSLVDGASQATGVRNTCGLCQDVAETYLVTSCKHSFCADCFEDFCRSIKSRNDIGFLRCPGQAGSCAKTFTLPELESLLSPFAFQDVLTSSFSSYVSNRPKDLRHCLTTGCIQLYRVAPADSPPQFKCAGCYESFCRRCHSDHPGISCILNRYYLGLGPLPTICRSCDGDVESLYEADYLLCPSCGVRICNLCCEFFSTEEACSDHLFDSHHLAWDFWETDESLSAYLGLNGTATNGLVEWF